MRLGGLLLLERLFAMIKTVNAEYPLDTIQPFDLAAILASDSLEMSQNYQTSIKLIFYFL